MLGGCWIKTQTCEGLGCGKRWGRRWREEAGKSVDVGCFDRNILSKNAGHAAVKIACTGPLAVKERSSLPANSGRVRVRFPRSPLFYPLRMLTFLTDSGKAVRKSLELAGCEDIANSYDRKAVGTWRVYDATRSVPFLTWPAHEGTMKHIHRCVVVGGVVVCPAVSLKSGNSRLARWKIDYLLSSDLFSHGAVYKASWCRLWSSENIASVLVSIRLIVKHAVLVLTILFKSIFEAGALIG